MALPIGLMWLWNIDEHGGFYFAAGLILGFTLDTALQSIFMSWDYLWHRDLISLLLTLILCGVTFRALWQQHNEMTVTLYEIEWRQVVWIILLGPFLALHTLVFQNVAFIASLLQVSLPVASLLILSGDVLAFAAVLWGRRLGQLVSIAAGIGLIAMAYLSDRLGVVTLPIAHLLMGLLLTKLIPAQPRKTEHPSALSRISLCAGVGSLLYLALYAAIEVDYQIDVQHGAAVVLAVGSLLMALAALRSNRPLTITINWRLLALPIFALLIPIGLIVSQPMMMVKSPAEAVIRIMTYNIHQGISIDGWVDPEAIAAAIEAQNPDVVVIQEMMRGQYAAGSLDVAEWLSRRLKMPFYFAPATDNTFGEALFTRLPVLAWQAGKLPYTEGAQPRSYVQVTLGFGKSEPVTIFGTHLDHISQKTRIPQVQQLLANWNHQPRTLIVGDMNSGPGQPENGLFLAAGLISAQDVTGNGSRFTFDSRTPRARIDWIYGTPDVSFSNFQIPQTLASDHLPVVVDVTLP
jgi:endonuclease/exonuclease/phosphatase family metal-dependent hydrolase